MIPDQIDLEDIVPVGLGPNRRLPAVCRHCSSNMDNGRTAPARLVPKASMALKIADIRLDR